MYYVNNDVIQEASIEMKRKVGLIGLGNAGLALATPIVRNFSVVGYDRDDDRCQLARDAGVDIAASAQSVAEQCEIVLLSLPNPAISRAVVEGIGASALRARLIVETSTVTPGDIAAISTLWEKWVGVSFAAE